VINSKLLTDPILSYEAQTLFGLDVFWGWTCAVSGHI